MHSIHQVHVSDYSPFGAFEAGHMVEAHTEQFVIMGFVGQTNYVNYAYHDLQSKCPKGRLQGITTQHSTSLGFFSWTNKILMQGLCLS
jgi:hypothetical protein